MTNITSKTDAEYISQLESKICDLVNHSHLTVAFIEEIMSGDGEIRKERTGSDDFYYIPERDAGALLYGVYELEAKLSTLKDEYYGRRREKRPPGAVSQIREAA